MQILKSAGIDWHERRMISKFYVDQRVKVRLDRGETRSEQTGGAVRQGWCLSPILFNLYSKCITTEALDGLGDFNIGGQIIQTVKYADDLVLMAKEETVLQCMIDKLSYLPAHKTHFFPTKCEKNLTRILCTEGKYYFQTYKYLYMYYTTSLSWDSEICFQIMRYAYFLIQGFTLTYTLHHMRFWVFTLLQ